MFEQVKQILTEKYNKEIAHYEELKSKVEELENEMRIDVSKEDYNNKIKGLNKKYNIFKRGKEYKEELLKIKKEYMEKLKSFENIHNNFIELSTEVSKINIYAIQKKLEQLTNASELSDLKISEEEAQNIINDALANL